MMGEGHRREEGPGRDFSEIPLLSELRNCIPQTRPFPLPSSLLRHYCRSQLPTRQFPVDGGYLGSVVLAEEEPDSQRFGTSAINYRHPASRPLVIRRCIMERKREIQWRGRVPTHRSQEDTRLIVSVRQNQFPPVLTPYSLFPPSRRPDRFYECNQRANRCFASAPSAELKVVVFGAGSECAETAYCCTLPPVICVRCPPLLPAGM